MNKTIWGPFIWKFLHLISLRIKDEYFESEKSNIIHYISCICDNLPCPHCSSHAIGFLNKYKIKFIKTKEDLIKILFLMHNDVNKVLNKEIIKEEKLYEIYKPYNFEFFALNYFKLNRSIHLGEKMMLYSLRRKQFLKKFYEYMKNNINKFDIMYESN